MAPIIPDLITELWTLAAQIPRGHVSTYGDVAAALGDVVASRFVGHVMLHHVHAEECPCHRLVRADGSLGKYVTGDGQGKAMRLRRDGVALHGDHVDLDRYRWRSFQTDRPLARLAAHQRQSATLTARLVQEVDAVNEIAGVDLSYVPDSNLAVATLVEVDLTGRKIGYQKLITRPVTFPYVTSYLAFRELPILLELLECVGRERNPPQVVLVDGSGVLHPRRAGIATMLGQAAGVPTVGVTKKHLAGKVAEAAGAEPREVWLDGRLSGFALSAASGSKKPLFVSPGYGMDPVAALHLVQAMLWRHRLPEPIYWADRLSRRAARQFGETALQAQRSDTALDQLQNEQ